MSIYLGREDLLLAKMVGDNFNVLYGKQIGGVGNDEIYNLETNSVGNLLLGLQSEFWFFVYDGINYLKDDGLKSICVWTFTSNLGVPEISLKNWNSKTKNLFL